MSRGKPPIHEAFHPIPNQSVFVASAFESFPPQLTDLFAEGRDGRTIYGHSIVTNVSTHDRTLVGSLVWNRIVHTSLQLLIDFSKF